MVNLKDTSKDLKNKRVMTKSLFFMLIIAFAFPTIGGSQNTNGIGLKAGFNYNSNGDYIEFVNSNIVNSDRKIGYHLGLFGKIGTTVYFRPELVYSITKSDYNNDSFNMQKLDAPLLAGYNILKHLSVFVGPSLQYILDSEFNSITINDIENDFSVGLNIGIGLNLDKFGIDLRYERGFSDNEAAILDNNNIDTNRLDTRPDQFILSLSLIL